MEGSVDESEAMVTEEKEVDAAVIAVAPVEAEVDVDAPEEENESDIMKAEQNLRGGRLYREHVRHSTLGLDLAMRLIHKHTQRRYEHPQYTQIFVYGLEEDSLSFDGFSLIDAR